MCMNTDDSIKPSVCVCVTCDGKKVEHLSFTLPSFYSNVAVSVVLKCKSDRRAYVWAQRSALTFSRGRGRMQR